LDIVREAGTEAGVRACCFFAFVRCCASDVLPPACDDILPPQAEKNIIKRTSKNEILNFKNISNSIKKF